jgi:hypothetical protein
MQPIVHRLQAEFEPDVVFMELNAADGDEGERIFNALVLPGHPSYVIYNAAGEEVYRTFGIVPAAQLRAEIPLE